MASTDPQSDRFRENLGELVDLKPETQKVKTRLGWIIGLSLLILTFIFFQVDYTDFQPNGKFSGPSGMMTGEEEYSTGTETATGGDSASTEAGYTGYRRSRSRYRSPPRHYSPSGPETCSCVPGAVPEAIWVRPPSNRGYQIPCSMKAWCQVDGTINTRTEEIETSVTKGSHTCACIVKKTMSPSPKKSPSRYRWRPRSRYRPPSRYRIPPSRSPCEVIRGGGRWSCVTPSPHTSPEIIV